MMIIREVEIGFVEVSLILYLACPVKTKP